MGQYLTIGLVTDIYVNTRRAKAEGATVEDVKAAMQEAHNQSGIYRMEENEDYVCLSLRPEVAESELTDMLEDFYKMRYDDDGRWQKVLEEIRKRTTLEEWTELAKSHLSERFQRDTYVWLDTPFHGGWSRFLPTTATQIILSIDGKIVMETYGGLFKFFTQLIRERLSKYRLSASLYVAITG